MAKRVPVKEVKKTIGSQYEARGDVALVDIKGHLSPLDIRTIQELIDLYDKVFPYPHPASIDKMTRDMRMKRRNEQADYNDFNELGKETELRHTISIPEGLLRSIKTAYPNIIRDRMQYDDFVKNFPRFSVVERY
jgi:hypothetical protein